MTAGRPRKPTALKIVQGTARPDRANPSEPKPPEGPVSPPSWLRGRAKTAWKWVAPVLEEMGVLTTADTHTLALLCDAYAEYIECRAVVRKLGATYEGYGEEGAVMIRPRPEVRMASDAWRRADRMFSAFGMTPSARSKIHASDRGEADPFEEFLSGHSSAS